MNKRKTIELLDELNLPRHLDGEAVFLQVEHGPRPHYADLNGWPFKVEDYPPPPEGDPELDYLMGAALDVGQQCMLAERLRFTDERCFLRTYLYLENLWISVLTSYLGQNHEYRPGLPPAVWETIIQFEPGEWTRRYTTLNAAHAGHAKIVLTLHARGFRVDRHEHGLLRENYLPR